MVIASILDIIPHRPPMVCVDELLDVTDITATTRFLVRPGFIFLQEGKITTSGLLENVAQTAAAHNGFLQKKNKEHLAVGFIVVVKKLEVHYFPEIHDELITSISIVHRTLNLTVVSGQILSNSKLVFSCELTISIPD